MYYTRNRAPLWTRLLGGLIIVLATVGVFIVYQTNQSKSKSATVTPSPAVIAEGTPVGQTSITATPVPITYRIVSNKAQISTVITELYYASDADNWDLSHLGSAAGHLEGTPEIGHGGNYVLAGHVELKDGSRGPFADLHSLIPGDVLTIIGDVQPTPIIRQYQVTDVGKVSPTDFAVMRNHGYEELTLITCDDYNPNTQTYNTRVIVHARPLVALLASATKALTPTRIPNPTVTPKKK